MAADQKKAIRQQAYLVLIDESGLLMAPLVRRTWSPRGHTPQLLQKGKHREKVSLAVAMWLSPHRDRVGLIYRTLVNGYFNNMQVADFLESLLRELPKRIIVIWDGGNMHKGPPIRNRLERFHPRLSLEPLPPWAPMLNPTEAIFSWLKYGQLANFAPTDAPHLNKEIKRRLNAIRNDQRTLQNFWHASDLPIPKPPR